MPTCRGTFFERRSTGKDAEMAAKYFERATQLDPSFALAWAWLSRARSWQVNQGLRPMEEGRRLAREAVERALSLDLALAKAHIEMGRLKQLVDSDWAGANASFQRASHAQEIAVVYAFSNQTDKAFEWLDRAYAQRDPGLLDTCQLCKQGRVEIEPRPA